ncbi:hypothetical protein BO83DRAFT_387799 [Aspergillus eucalypticola CBS 122712]|uniref:Uncharacterized protein n=1 Tax=Aspergillus eucalypticola (strain CBS 122712 / IBT 29274) TaxID=1448314 RepID=A0A317VN89_ASPEC|nr:uncharacterized protein BO83DRAFT_387799 [Aspergillus eucalypticola CBS 122712]PWY75786.1 hypothetical protein BO83DRAFT_387799 [Aspergillus eucalypticola CBS 122712]
MEKSQPRPKSPPDYPNPASPFPVDVRILNTSAISYDETGNTRLYLPPWAFLEPILRGFRGPQAPIYCFLISHEEHHIIFYLGSTPTWRIMHPRPFEQSKQPRSDAAGRSVREISFDHDSPLRVGPFNIVDYFGDGFFYILDAPGQSGGALPWPRSQNR